VSDADLASCRSQYQGIARRLDGAKTAEQRDGVKNEIVALFKTVDQAISDFTGLKEEIRVLVDRYKQLAAAAGGEAAPQMQVAAPLHADHIGASTFIQKGWSLISLEDYEGAIQALQKALKLSPGDIEAETLLGWAQMEHRDFDDALATFQTVLNKNPANTLARINLGQIYLQKRNFQEAVEHLSKAIRLDNDKKATLYAHLYLGQVYMAREMFEDAQTFFQKTIVLGPNLLQAYFEMGRAQWFAGEPDAAKATWDQGFKANKFNPWGKKCKEMLDIVTAGGEPPR
jgi:tetratricopeptide (TPR) repeat protein